MRFFCPSAIFDYLGGTAEGQNGRKSANIEVKSQKSANKQYINQKSAKTRTIFNT